MAQTLSCPIPSNINPLQSNGFQFNITKLPNLTFFCQEVNIPSISLPSPELSNPFSIAPIPGDKLDFDDLTVQFLIDEEMQNYISIQAWMIALGFPKNYEQYKNFINDQDGNLITELSKSYSDATLQILNSSNNAVRTISFRDVFPVSLQSLTLQSTLDSTQYLTGIATFKYTYYEFT